MNLFKDNKIKKLTLCFSDAQKYMSSALSKLPLAKDADFETAVFLQYLMLQRYYSESFVHDLNSEVSHIVSDKCKTIRQQKGIKNRMKLYTEISNGAYQPRGFWFMQEPSEKALSSAKICAMVAFGDVLIYPECAENYLQCPFPVFDIFELSTFVAGFTGNVWNMYDAYLRGIGLK